MAKKTKAQQAALLNSIVNDTKGPQGYSLVHSDDVKALLEAGHIEVNHNITDPSGKIAARATAKLLESNGATADATGADSAPAVTFALESGIPLPPAQKGGRRDEQYPFSKMEVGQSFFVPVTEKYPKPWETFGSTVSAQPGVFQRNIQLTSARTVRAKNFRFSLQPASSLCGK